MSGVAGWGEIRTGKIKSIVALAIVAIVGATFIANRSSFERDKTYMLTIPVNATIYGGTEYAFQLDNVSSVASVSALVYGQIEECKSLRDTQLPGLICPAGESGYTVKVYLNGRGIKASSLSFSAEPLTPSHAPIREVFFRFDVTALREGENKIALQPLVPRFIERIEIWATLKNSSEGGVS